MEISQPNDEASYLSGNAARAYDAVHALNFHVHYLPYTSGVGRRAPERDGD